MAGRPSKQEPQAPVPKRAAALALHFTRKRLALGESQMVFAKRLGIAQNQISEIEQGRANPKLITLERWADSLCMDVTELLRFPTKP